MIVHRYPEEDLHPRTKVKRQRKTSVIAKDKLIGSKWNVLSLSTHDKFTLLESTSLKIERYMAALAWCAQSLPRLPDTERL